MDIRRRMLVKKKSSSSSGSTGDSYTVNLNGQWEVTTAVPNPDSTLYDGVYRSVSNYNVHNGVATMYITIKDCSSFRMYIRSYAESSCDYVMVSQLDQTITGSTSYSNTTLVKAHTSSNQQSGTLLSNYTLVEFTGITSGEHTITVVYRKDGSVNRNDDRGYVLIEKSQAGSGDDDGQFNIDNYLTIEALEDGLTASLTRNDGINNENRFCEYCVNGDENWKVLFNGEVTESINAGDTLSFRGELSTLAQSSSDTYYPSGIGTFNISKKCNLKGNCMSMLFGDDAASNYSLSGKYNAFNKLFYNCSNIITVSSGFLPAMQLIQSCYSSMFEGCTSLTTTPNLPATKLGPHCCYHMFYGCTSLKTAPTTLLAISLAERCYCGMFYGCTSLTTAPKLPATTLAEYCYQYMFYNCTSLKNAPTTLPATTLTKYCYQYMFEGCTSLTTAPTTLPATTLADSCYSSMFEGCTSLKTAPTTLPATTLTEDCYYHMFYGCTSLTTAPKLSATTLAKDCYYGMFYNCTSLKTAPELPATTLANYCYGSMFYNCTALTTAPKLPATTLANYCYVSMFHNCTSLKTAPELPATTLAERCYDSMFEGCTSLTTAPTTLPATTLTKYCYQYMFAGCESLTTAPKLPATTLANYCYYYMFTGCEALTTAPKLPATTLANYCYYFMFNDCTKLNYIKMLATDISASSCLYCWTRNVANTGTFVKNPAMNNLPTGTNGIPSGWTVINDGEESGGNDGPVTFSIQDADGLVTEYTIPYQMTWEEFINSDFNETKIDVIGWHYEPFILINDIPSYVTLYNGIYDSEEYIIDPELDTYVAKNQQIKPLNYYI